MTAKHQLTSAKGSQRQHALTPLSVTLMPVKGSQFSDVDDPIVRRSQAAAERSQANPQRPMDRLASVAN
jgi:hypothetical protein